MDKATNDTRLALLEQARAHDRQRIDADMAAMRADIQKLKLHRDQNTAQRDRHIRWLSYGLIAAVLTNVFGAQEAAAILMQMVGGRG